MAALYTSMELGTKLGCSGGFARRVREGAASTSRWLWAVRLDDGDRLSEWVTEEESSLLEAREPIAMIRKEKENLIGDGRSKSLTLRVQGKDEGLEKIEIKTLRID